MHLALTLLPASLAFAPARSLVSRLPHSQRLQSTLPQPSQRRVAALFKTPSRDYETPLFRGSLAPLHNSPLAPRAKPRAETALSWLTFAGALAAMAGGFHVAGLHTLFGVPAKTWDAAAMAYPAVVMLSAAFTMARYDDQGKGGEKLALAMGGHESHDAKLRKMVEQVHARSGLGGAAPRVFVVPAAEPNAFAAGTKASVVAVTTGLLDLLTAGELRAVLAHEIGHVRNQDMARSLQAAAMVAGLGFVMSFGETMMRTDRRRDSKKDKESGDSAAFGLILYAAGAVSYALGSLLRLGNSRTAEYAADAFAKSIGAGPDLASALNKLGSFDGKVERSREGLGLASGAFASSYIDNPPARESPLLTLGGLLRTHPSMEDRITRLLAED